MKEVVVIRHAPKNIAGQLTSEGQKIAEKLKSSLGKFDLIISSPMPRARETAQLLTAAPFVTDTRARIPDFTFDEEKELFKLGQNHPHGIAGVIFDTPHFRKRAKIQGQLLVNLIEELFQKLPASGRALIVSHDGTMVAAEKILQKKELDKAERNYEPLSGYKVDEKLRLTYFSLMK